MEQKCYYHANTAMAKNCKNCNKPLCSSCFFFSNEIFKNHIISQIYNNKKVINPPESQNGYIPLCAECFYDLYSQKKMKDTPPNFIDFLSIINKVRLIPLLIAIIGGLIAIVISILNFNISILVIGIIMVIIGIAGISVWYFLRMHRLRLIYRGWTQAQLKNCCNRMLLIQKNIQKSRTDL